MRTTAREADFFWPLAALAALAMTLLVLGVVTLAREFDRSALTREQTVVGNGLASRADEVAMMVTPQAVWDDAVRHLDNRFDADWARLNIGQFLIETDGFDEVFVLDGDDRPLLTAERRGRERPERYDAVATLFAPLVSRVRADERQARGGARAGRAGDPIQASTFAILDGRPHILGVALVASDFGAARPRGPRSALVATAMELDQAFLEGLARRYLLSDLRFLAGDRPVAEGRARAPIRAFHGTVIGALDWTPQNPGQALLPRVMAPILAVIAALSVLTLLLYRRGRRISEGLIASEARAAQLAYFDVLTGLPNRVLFEDRLRQALAQARRTGETVAVHCIDLDRFKLVNDTFGHQAGDELIQAAARRMTAQHRETDTLCRLSGDEFALVQTRATAAGAAAVAARFTEALAEPFDLSAGRVFIGCSVGVTLVMDPAIEPGEALRQADLALYGAKENGKDQYRFFELEMDSAVRSRRALESDLRAALTAGELALHYQPQVNGRGVMTGVEALLRWTHPTRGALSPAFFVPIAEECGLIDALGFYVLRRAFEDSRRWPGLRIAVNVSANQLRIKDFSVRIAALAEEMGVDPRRFELEITEGVLLGDDPATQEQLRRLRQLGFSLALDDFGTGYSSLSYLQRFPISKIKIDRSFVANLGLDGEAEAVIGAIVKLARALKLSVIAEGVETEDQRERLAQVGCAAVQGFLFGRPVEAEAIDRLRQTPGAKLRPAPLEQAPLEPAVPTDR